MENPSPSQNPPMPVSEDLEKKNAEALEQQRTQEINSMKASQRVLGNVFGLLNDGLFPGAHAEVVAEAKRYVSALKERAEENLAHLQGSSDVKLAKVQKAAEKRARKSWLSRLKAKTATKEESNG